MKILIRTIYIYYSIVEELYLNAFNLHLFVIKKNTRRRIKTILYFEKKNDITHYSVLNTILHLNTNKECIFEKNK